MALLDDAARTSPIPDGESVKTLDGVHVLIVDDEEEITELYSMSLSAAGATVHSTFDGASALDALRAGTFDVVISDLDMPLLDGIAMIRAVRQSESFGPVPAMAVTGSTRLDAREHALSAGFDAFAVKPLSAPRLVEAVRQLLRKSERT